MVVTVVVGKATGPFANEAPHVTALAAVPITLINNNCPRVGVPERFVVNDVIASD